MNYYLNNIKYYFFVIVFNTERKWNREFETSDILNVIIAIIVTFIFPVTLGKNIESTKSKSQILIQHIENIKKEIDDMKDLIINYIASSADKRKTSVQDILFSKMRSVSWQITYLEQVNKNLWIISDDSIKELKDNFQLFKEISNDFRTDEFDFDSTYLTLFDKKSQEEIMKNLYNLKIEILS